MRSSLLALALGMLCLPALTQSSPPPAPANFQVTCHTTSGDFTLAIHRAWAPHGADRFYELLNDHYYRGNAFYRVIPGFVVQWGLSPLPAANAYWSRRRIPDDPVRESNSRGTITFADSGRNTRTTVVFINLKDNHRLDKSGFAPFGTVIAGMGVVSELEDSYGEGPPAGHGPDPRLIDTEGAAYLTRNFPRLDVIYGCRVH